MDEGWRIPDTADYICTRNYSIVAAQFPDDLLKDAARVSTLLQAACMSRGHSVKVYLLADTTYNSLSVDEVAASHVGAHCVIHYGRASLTRLSRLPAFFVFPRQTLDAEAAAEALAGSSVASGSVASGAPIVVLLDQPYLQQLPELRAALERRSAAARWVFADVPTRHLDPAPLADAAATSSRCCRPAPGDMPCEAAETHSAPAAGSAGPTPPGERSAAGYTWRLDPASADKTACSFAWVGAPDAPALSQLQLTRSAAPWALFDPGTGALREGVAPEAARLLRRRYYLVERARNASIVGVLVGTLGVAGYQDAVDGLRAAARRAGKKTYTLLMGKPSPAKLANFPEVEVFVMVADPQGQILDSKDYLAPIITPHEAMLAFTPGAEWDAAAYRLDFDGVLQEKRDGVLQERRQGVLQEARGAAEDSGGEEPRFSLLDGAYHGGGTSVSAPAAGPDESDPTVALAVRAQQALTVSAAPGGGGHLVQPQSAADFFVHKRSWTGVEAPVVGAEAKPVERAAAGRSGRAAGYADEASQCGTLPP